MKSRRNFILHAGLVGGGYMITPDILSHLTRSQNNYPLTIATWNNKKAIEASWKILQSMGNALDAVEAGARVPEADVNDTSVGYGGFLDREGKVTLDACIMDHLGNAGSVMFLEGIMHPISVARKVMEKTPHVFLSGAGAKKFALEQGFKEENLLTDFAKAEWQKWLKTSEYQPKINRERHDTIGILAIDHTQNISGACSTSGLAYKMHGRVGDSPIIGAGLYVDNEVGAATATGLGEAVIKKVGAFSIVEMMRSGLSPQLACEKAIERLTTLPNAKNFQVGYIAIDKSGNTGACSLQPGFEYVVESPAGFELSKSKSFF
jgi:isoaspartyl peptidase/L-asparaginase-like protein (Ntn-hydrolase superfamily)